MPGRKPKVSDEDLVWQRYGKLQALFVFRTYSGTRYVKVQCDCGRQYDVRTNDWGTTAACKKCWHDKPDSARRRKLKRAPRKDHGSPLPTVRMKCRIADKR